MLCPHFGTYHRTGSNQKQHDGLETSRLGDSIGLLGWHCLTRWASLRSRLQSPIMMGAMSEDLRDPPV